MTWRVEGAVEKREREREREGEKKERDRERAGFSNDAFEFWQRRKLQLKTLPALPSARLERAASRLN